MAMYPNWKTVNTNHLQPPRAFSDATCWFLLGGLYWFSGKWIPRRAVFSMLCTTKNHATRGKKSSSNHHFDTFRKKIEI